MSEPSIIKFERAIEELEPVPIIPDKRDFSACKHAQSVINREARRLTCRDCGCELDPYEKLWQLANNNDAIDKRMKIIQEYERQKRLTAERIASAEKAGLPARIAKIQIGDVLQVEVCSDKDNPGYISKYKAPVLQLWETCFWMGHCEYGYQSYRIDHADIVKFRTIRRAERP